jgi:hypothetical protein
MSEISSYHSFTVASLNNLKVSQLTSYHTGYLLKTAPHKLYQAHLPFKTRHKNNNTWQLLGFITKRMQGYIQISCLSETQNISEIINKIYLYSPCVTIIWRWVTLSADLALHLCSTNTITWYNLQPTPQWHKIEIPYSQIIWWMCESLKSLGLASGTVHTNNAWVLPVEQDTHRQCLIPASGMVQREMMVSHCQWRGVIR